MSATVEKRRVAVALAECSAVAVPAPPGLWAGIAAELQGANSQSSASPVRRSVIEQGSSSRLRLARPGAVALLLLLLALLLTAPFWLARGAAPAEAAALLEKASAAGAFVPAGTVRHIVTARAFGERTATPDWLQDLWLANGRSHLLLWKPAPRPGSLQPLPDFISWDTKLVDDETLWQYYASSNQVYKSPYFAPSLQAELPSAALIDALLKKPDTHIAGSGTLDGRAVVIVAGHVGTIVSGSPLQIAEGAVPGYSTAQHDYKLWIDSQTYQIVQEQHYVRPDKPAPGAPAVYTDTTWIMSDELLAADAIPADLFKFRPPAGAQVVDASALPVPTPAAPAPEQQGWRLFTSAEGRFSTMMPGPVDYGFSSGGGVSTPMFGLKRGGVSYVVRYSDYPAETVTRKGAQDWLDLERDGVIAQSQGKLLAESQLTLDGTPGREVRSSDPDGRYRLTRLYLDGARLYKLTIVAPAADTAPDDVQRFISSFRILPP